MSTNIDSEPIANIEEDMTCLLGHELYHFLRHSRQIEGRNTQAQANVYGFVCLREFKRTLLA
jgi:hypothetical protein